MFSTLSDLVCVVQLLSLAWVRAVSAALVFGCGFLMASTTVYSAFKCGAANVALLGLCFLAARLLN